MADKLLLKSGFFSDTLGVPGKDLFCVAMLASPGLDGAFIVAELGVANGLGAIGVVLLGLAATFGAATGADAAVAGLLLAIVGLLAVLAPGFAWGTEVLVLVFLSDIRYSCALNTCRQEPQRTAPWADCNWLCVTRNAVAHFGQRVIMELLADVISMGS